MTAEQPLSVSAYVSLDIDLLNGERPARVELAEFDGSLDTDVRLEFIRVRLDMLMRLRAFALLSQQTS